MKKTLLTIVGSALLSLAISAQCTTSGIVTPVCFNSAAQNLSTTGSAIFGSGVSGNTFNPSVAGQGSHEIISIDNEPSYIYTVNTAGTFAPVLSVTPGTAVTLSDDAVSGILSVGFDFTFFGNTYSDFYISSNGFISFDAGVINGCCSGSPIPAADFVNNSISWAWNDLNPASGGTISYQTIGVAPNRRLLVAFSNQQHYGNGAPANTSQIILYETSNIIEIHSSSISDDGSTMTQGIENAAGTQAYFVAGRNAANWTATNDFVSFTPDVLYVVNQTGTFAPVASAGTAVTLADDAVSGNLPIGFSFPFFGNTYSEFYISSNGFISFDAGVSQGCCSGGIFPTADGVNNVIAWAWNDFWPPGNGSITYETVGTAPSRRLLVTFTDQFDCCSGPEVNTSQIILYETLNIIEIHTTVIGYDGTAMTQGIENSNGTSAYFAAGRNSSNWTVTNDYIAFIPGVICDSDVIVVEGTLTGTDAVTFCTGGSYTFGTQTLTTGGTYTEVFTTAGAGCDSTVTLTLTENSGLTGTGVTHCQSLASQSLTSAFVCGAIGNTIAQNITFNSESLVVIDAQWQRNGGGTTCNGAAGTDEYYDVFTFTVSTAGSYTFNMCAASFDSHASLYQNAFNGANPCGTPGDFIIANDDGNNANCGLDPRITAVLSTGTTYYLISTSYSAGSTGAYDWTFTGPTGATISSGVGPPGTLEWYTVASGGAAIGTSSSFDPVGVAGSGLANTNTAGTTTYYLACSNAPTCRSSYDYVIEPNHTITAVANQSVCINTAMTNITMTLGGGATGATVTGLPAGVTAAVTGVTLTISGTPTANGSFNYSVTTAGNGCTVATTTGILRVDNASAAPTGISGATTICLGGATALTVTGGALGTGASYQWFTGSCNGVAAGTGTSINVSPTANTTYYVNASASASGSCPATVCINSTVTLPNSGTALSRNSEAATCLVDQNNFIHFFHSSGRLLAAINSNGQDLGNVSVTSYVPGAPIDVNACNSTSAHWITATMGRHWLITPQNQPTLPVTVRLLYDDSPLGELDQLIALSGLNLNIDDDVLFPTDLKMTKYSGPSNVNSNPFDNCFIVGGAATIFTQTATGQVQSYLPGFNAFARYADFSINGFSEFWLHGSTIQSPLPVEMANIDLNCTANNKSINLSWTTQSEINCSEFRIERSFNALDWSVVGVQTGAGNSNTTIDYSFSEEKTNQLTYYRLAQVDFDGTVTYFDPLSIICAGDNSVTVSPNPISGEYKLSLYSTSSLDDSKLIIMDGLGKIVKSNSINIPSGNSTHHYNLDGIASGVYMLYLKTSNNDFSPIPIVKTN
ncbi:MAG: hypothetical protein ACI9N1_000556 [Flavobacteriales bacterium]|jgi:hypothetical protein